MSFENQLLQFMAAANYRPMKQHELAHALHIDSKGKRTAFRHELYALEDAGKITRLRKNRWSLPDVGKWSAKFRDALLDIQEGKVDDPFSWVVDAGNLQALTGFVEQ